jgi:hypothetical protein
MERILTKIIKTELVLEEEKVWEQRVTKRCCLSWLTNSAFVYEPKCGGRGVAGSQPMSTALHNAHGAQINVEDLLHRLNDV